MKLKTYQNDKEKIIDVDTWSVVKAVFLGGLILYALIFGVILIISLIIGILSVM